MADVYYTGAQCRGCDWMGDDPEVAECPRCGHALTWWATSQFELVPKSWPYSTRSEDEE